MLLHLYLSYFGCKRGGLGGHWWTNCKSIFNVFI